MTHEIKLLFQTLDKWQKLRKKAVFVSVVALDGSSYRRPGVRMIISESGDYIGAVSGGCVEGEIERQAQTVFRTGKPKIITYDGRLRIGCEGVLYILIEPVFISDDLINNFNTIVEKRQSFSMESFYQLEFGEHQDIGTVLNLMGKSFPIHPSFQKPEKEKPKSFKQVFGPLFQLVIFGAEHDAVQLCKAAKLLGWEVIVIASPEESKSCDFFPGASALISPTFENLDTSIIDDQTAVLLMTHSFNKDVQYLMALKDTKPVYIGLLGSVKRKDRVLSLLLEYCPETTVEFMEQIHGPAGINIGAESAAEVALSILAEILGKVRKQKLVSLRDKIGSIHG